MNSLNDIKLSSNNNFLNKCKTINDNQGINNNDKSNINPLRIKDKVISKVNNESSNVSNNNKINDDNNNNSNNNNNDNNNTNDDNNDNDNKDNNSNNKYNINENNENLATNNQEKRHYDITNNKIANNKNKSNFKINIRKKSVNIVGESMVKEVNGFELSKTMKHKYSIRVIFHPSAKTSCINDRVKTVIRNQEADHIILDTGTNDLSSEKTPVQICSDIVNLAMSIKDKDIKVIISEIVGRNDAQNE